MEYYPGILILTTNRVGSFDEAIKSRVHCALYYPPLTEEQSLKIWKMNLDTLDKNNESLDPSLKVRHNRRELEKFAKKHWSNADEGTRWNGRQIKNAFQTAVALAEWDHHKDIQASGRTRHPDGPLLSKSHFKIVAEASRHFDDYLINVRGTDESWVKSQQTRFDGYPVSAELGAEKPRGTRGTAAKPAKASKTKTKSNSKSKHTSKPSSKRAPASSDEASSDSNSSEEESETGDDTDDSAEDGESESESDEEPPPPPPPKAKKKKKDSGKRKSGGK